MRKFFCHFIIGAIAYPLMEIAFRGYSHWTMSITGGLAFNLLLGVGKRFRYKPLALQSLLGAEAITALEFAMGCIVNKWLKMAVWDYSHLPGHIMGQICLPFFALWYALCLPVLWAASRFRRHPHPWLKAFAIAGKAPEQAGSGR
ncbi:MAG: putative ABC transporter permease [Firmicutes bacterium]|nr:putative ABC transporter permease [Bacillota bacterium]